MPNSQQSIRANVAGNHLYLTADGLTNQSLLGLDRRATVMDSVTAHASGQTLSTVIPPANVGIAIVGVSVEMNGNAAALAAHLEATTRGNALLGTNDVAYGSFNQVTPDVRLGAGAGVGNITDILPCDSNVLLVNGNGTNPLWAIRAPALVPPDEITFHVHYVPLFGEAIGC